MITDERFLGQRPQREQDPTVRRSFLAALLASTILVAGGLGIVALRVHQVQLAYRVDALHAERARSERLIRQLEVEVATLRSPGRLESRARELGMTTPSREQVRMAREYVPTGSGPAAGPAPRGTVAARVPGGEALVR